MRRAPLHNPDPLQLATGLCLVGALVVAAVRLILDALTR